MSEPIETIEQVTEPTPWEQEHTTTPSDDDILAALETPSEAVRAKIDEMVAAAVKKALAGATPRKQPVKTDPLTREQFAKMTYQERCKLFESNRPLYEKLKGEL